MSVYTMGAVPRTLNLRKKPSAARTTSVAVSAAARAASSSRTGLPGALAPPVKTLNLRKKPVPAPGLNKRKLPGSAPAPAPISSGTAIASDQGWYDGGGSETFVPAPSGGGGGGGGGFAPVSDERPIVDPSDGPKDGIPLWAAIGGIALCAVVGFALLSRQGVV